MAKQSVYQTVEEQILAVLEGETNTGAKMATVSCLLHQAFSETFYWTGFYVCDEMVNYELVVGPYQGTLGCLRIKFGRGVCGTAAAKKQTQIVKDVHAISNHIACDAKSVSEIVVPVFDAQGALIAVLDIDSTEPAMFDDIDKNCLESIVKAVFS
ncbi:MAG: GAF domain-containing protein [Kordiimonadaceae bacterium]|nr:GAF domain-containing protein [Kordiimonadaceae bacterium]